MTTIDTSSAVFKDTILSYMSARQVGEMDHLAFIAAMHAYDGTQMATPTLHVRYAPRHYDHLPIIKSQKIS